MFDIRGKKGRKIAMPGATLVHPDFTVALKYFCINRFQALRTNTGGVLDFSPLAV